MGETGWLAADSGQEHRNRTFRSHRRRIPMPRIGLAMDYTVKGWISFGDQSAEKTYETLSKREDIDNGSTIHEVKVVAWDEQNQRTRNWP